MTKIAVHDLSIEPLSDSLAAAYREAALNFAAVIEFGTAREILAAFRAALAAEMALLRDSGGPTEQAIADALAHEIAEVDRDLAERANHRPN